MKSVLVLIFLLYLTPGSGQLVWDGIPLNSRTEVAVLALLTVVSFSREIRKVVRQEIDAFRWRALVRPGLVLLCFLKFLSFAWSPYSEGFEACYRSLYRPLTDSNVCEKSFNAPFLRADGLPFKNSSRVDPVVDFGESTYDWSLPFMNEYRRFGDLWLDRLAFNAKYFGVVNVSEEDDMLLPIFGIGEIAASVNNKKVFQSANYDRPFLSVAPLESARSEVQVEYQYRDDASDDPEGPPTPRGPYAQLKIGAPMSAQELIDVARIRITGAVSSPESLGLSELSVVDRKGNVVEFRDLNSLRIAQQEPDELLRRFDFEVEIPAGSLAKAPLEIRDGSSTILGTILNSAKGPLIPVVQQPLPTSSAIKLSADLTLDRSSLTAFAPGTHDSPSLLLRTLLILLDLTTLLIAVFLAVILVRTMRLALPLALGLAALTWLAIEPLDTFLPAIIGGGRELVIPYALVALVVVLTHRLFGRFTLPILLPASLVLAVQKVLEHVYFNHPQLYRNWWGKLLFHWRDSDWLANEGLARSILVEGSLRGGESIFWFRAGPRYVIYAAQMMFGENHVLIGIITVAIGFLVVLYLATRLAQEAQGTAARLFAVFVAFICLIFVGDQLVVAFGFFVSSEYPTWIGLFAVTTYLVGSGREHQAWMLVTVAATLAGLAHFRPNSVFVSVALIAVVLLMKVEFRSRNLDLRPIALTVTTFLVVISLSLLHNLYYGAEFVPFTPNPTLMYVFDIREVLVQDGYLGVIRRVWSQLAAVMYWRIPHDPNFAIFFWGCQFALGWALMLRARNKSLWRPITLTALLPVTYIAPMLVFALDSYYPRLLVTASLLCLTSAVLVWPRDHQAVTTIR
jgi:hypothetical protein